MARLRVGVLISGRGSNLQALIDACADPEFPAEIVLVLSNKADAYGLERARLAGVTGQVVSHRDFPDKPSFEAAMDGALAAAGVELVCLAGFMRLLTAEFVERWRDRMINIHPSLLPSFKGLDTHARALAAGVRFTGCTVHYVRPAMDEGPIIIQAAVPVLADDDDHALADRVLVAEHRCYPLALRLIAEGRVRVEGERATVMGPAALAGEPLLNPVG
ncbi:phosphoribosylglycinamide formyltransferase [Skermanella stibiiresistens SB22]|uniref:Phosphoribosylglycinamide formyltransferase n=1 Tax=Skermanella stibiiresistens SB22 TaxID=1385369 RepID=W9H1C2_9PROT|nr:phosphoribosylglycinamide formyltransferase [Skermanella stibiiresistens]EWY39980.1 phosphoribosylglycinamide formyltransferase [Skermanella stibiiresistens SB22]